LIVVMPARSYPAAFAGVPVSLSAPSPYPRCGTKGGGGQESAKEALLEFASRQDGANEELLALH